MIKISCFILTGMICYLLYNMDIARSESQPSVNQERDISVNVALDFDQAMIDSKRMAGK